MVVAACPRCASAVTLLQGRVVVASDGTVVMWHRPCWDARDIPRVPVAAYALLPERPRRAMKYVATAIVASSLASLGMASWTWKEMATPAAELAAVDISEPEPVRMHEFGAAREELPQRPVGPETSLEAWTPIPDENGRPVDELYPSLRAWIHPVTASAELVPAEKVRQFGEPRAGIDDPRPDCGAGHCGIDLDGPEGRPIVAVTDGVIVWVERHELGLDGKSGRFVRIRHTDGTLTSYMHLDMVADGLEAGDHVVGGEFIGTLGSTACYEAPAHLHFSVELPVHASSDLETKYIDPAPFLARATIIPAPDRRRPELPVF
jgi:murein DD-endopeptidase MepM/ murein hydrolase activator NlpD